MPHPPTTPRLLRPVKCPNCGEAQNTMADTPADGFDPDREPFGPVSCMVCGRAFSREEYLAGLDAGRAGEGNVIRFPGRG